MDGQAREVLEILLKKNKMIDETTTPDTTPDTTPETPEVPEVPQDEVPATTTPAE